MKGRAVYLAASGISLLISGFSWVAGKSKEFLNQTGNQEAPTQEGLSGDTNPTNKVTPKN